MVTPASNSIRVGIADDHAIVREGLRTLLSGQPQISLVGEASDGEEAVALIARETPDIILMDIAIQTVDGVAVSQRVQRAALPTKVILLTSALGGDLRLQEALDAGVMGYLLKHVSRDELLSAIGSVHNGAPSFHPDVLKQLAPRATGKRQLHEALTPREFDILKEIALGKSNKAIAQDLGLTEGTVKGYVSTVLSKLAVADRTQAALYAVKNGLGV